MTAFKKLQLIKVIPEKWDNDGNIIDASLVLSITKHRISNESFKYSNNIETIKTFGSYLLNKEKIRKVLNYFKEMIKMREEINFFKPYDETFKTWSDAFGNWNKMTEEFYGSIFGNGNKENRFKFFGDVSEWYKPGSNFSEIMEKMPLPYEAMKNVNESFKKGINAYKEIGATCIRNITDMATEGYAMQMRTIFGEDVNTDRFFDSVLNGYDEITAKTVDALKGTPFEGIKEIEQTVKQSRDALYNERKTIRNLTEEMLNFTSRMTKLSVSALKHMTENLADIRKNGVISFKMPEKMLRECGETHKNMMRILGLPDVLIPEYNNAVDNTVCLAIKRLEVTASLMEMNLKSGQAMRGIFVDILRFGKDSLKQGKDVSYSQICKEWTETCEETMRKFIDASKLNGNLSKFISSYTDWMKSANTHYRNIVSLPYVTRAELNEVKKSIGKGLAGAEL